MIEILVAMVMGASLGMGVVTLLWYRAEQRENDTEEPRYENTEQVFPMDSPDEDTDPSDDSAVDENTAEQFSEFESVWEYTTEFVDPQTPAKRVEEPLNSDIIVVESNGRGDYRSVRKDEWTERVMGDE